MSLLRLFFPFLHWPILLFPHRPGDCFIDLVVLPMLPPSTFSLVIVSFDWKKMCCADDLLKGSHVRPHHHHLPPTIPTEFYLLHPTHFCCSPLRFTAPSSSLSLTWLFQRFHWVHLSLCECRAVRTCDQNTVKNFFIKSLDNMKENEKKKSLSARCVSNPIHNPLIFLLLSTLSFPVFSCYSLMKEYNFVIETLEFSLIVDVAIIQLSNGSGTPATTSSPILRNSINRFSWSVCDQAGVSFE